MLHVEKFKTKIHSQNENINESSKSLLGAISLIYSVIKDQIINFVLQKGKKKTATKFSDVVGASNLGSKRPVGSMSRLFSSLAR